MNACRLLNPRRSTADLAGSLQQYVAPFLTIRSLPLWLVSEASSRTNKNMPTSHFLQLNGIRCISSSFPRLFQGKMENASLFEA